MPEARLQRTRAAYDQPGIVLPRTGDARVDDAAFAAAYHASERILVPQDPPWRRPSDNAADQLRREAARNGY